MSLPLLELTSRHGHQGETRALDDVSITIHEGAHTAILGPNGAGKTTLLNLLTFEDRPLALLGAPPAVRVLGRDVWHVFELRQQIGIVSSNLHGRFVAGHSSGAITGEDAVVSGFFATQGVLLYVSVTEQMREQARAALARVDASHLAGKTLDEMSTGEARRVLIARTRAASACWCSTSPPPASTSLPDTASSRPCGRWRRRHDDRAASHITSKRSFRRSIRWCCSDKGESSRRAGSTRCRTASGFRHRSAQRFQ